MPTQELTLEERKAGALELRKVLGEKITTYTYDEPYVKAGPTPATDSCRLAVKGKDGKYLVSLSVKKSGYIGCAAIYEGAPMREVAGFLADLSTEVGHEVSITENTKKNQPQPGMGGGGKGGRPFVTRAA